MASVLDELTKKQTNRIASD